MTSVPTDFQTRGRTPTLVQRIAWCALALTVALWLDLLRQPVSAIARIAFTLLCVWHGRALIVLSQPLTPSREAVLTLLSTPEKKNSETDRYTRIGIAYWNWAGVIAAGLLLRAGFGLSFALGAYFCFPMNKGLAAVLVLALLAYRDTSH